MRYFLMIAAIVLSSVPGRAAGFGDWAAIVVAGDYRAHSGAASEVFDNARRDVAADLARIGFKPANIMQFSVKPETHRDTLPRQSNGQAIANGLWDLSNRTAAGCLAYFTSHGSPDGIVVGDEVMSPVTIGQMLDNTCGDRPTVVIVSACFSGVFINQYTPKLQAPNRFVLTAARPDRTSFGCGEAYKYTFFDECVLSSLPASGDFPDLARNVIACVSAREKKEGVLPSQPQLFVGAQVANQLPTWK